MQDAAFAQRVSWAKSLARGRWKAILLAAGVSEELLAKQNKSCPACGGTDRFSFLDRDGDGTYFCRGCGGGDGFSLLMKVQGKGFVQALEFVERFCGIVPKTAEPSEKKSAGSDRVSRARATAQNHASLGTSQADLSGRRRLEVSHRARA